tara:strand:+ start:1722 stop:2264 length:543 start_codon:yes stop_codon:yes gene_type:complete
MTKNQTLNKITRFHKEWINFVEVYALNKNQKLYSEDFVQAMYLKLLKSKTFDYKKLYVDNKINYQKLKGYILRTLKSIMIDDHKKKAIQTVRLSEKFNPPDIIEVKENLEVVFKKIEKTINNMYWYDKKMLNLYVYHIPSIRKISTATTISSKSVFKTLKRCKLTIKKEIANEYYYGKTG